ncbi:hypothetical protein [Citrobacter sp. RHB35-C17]|uniref:hypothetical protein n=1 Tax=Citrobacter sp. RHB35-C17 TaxID=2742625 RepID=UPI0015E8F587|nr:hypothetical protein [Citrobacter sp. RHB35-C17]QMD64667.1 hypothetical protein HVZ37_22970 [Citrobacter sp. RHB35-C17]HBL7007462.1 hypothetical protein [Citrobacter koseri]
MNKKTVFLLLSVVSSSSFAASTPATAPSDACHFLSAMPFIKPPSTYKPYFEGSEEYTCGTPYFEIETPGSGVTMNNNIAYYVSGNDAEINKLMLMVNMNNQEPDAVKIARSYFINGSFEIMKKMFPDSPGKVADIVSLLSDGKDGEWGVDGWKVTSAKKVWPTGRGYELRFTVTTD